MQTITPISGSISAPATTLRPTIVPPSTTMVVTPKLMVRELLRKLSEEATFEDIIESIRICAAIREGEMDLAAGRVTSIEDVQKEIATWHLASS